MLKRHWMFWLGFSVALGGTLAIAVVALARPSKSPTMRTANTPGVPAVFAVGALNRPATAADALPPEAAATAGALLNGAPSASSDANPGSLASSKSRRLLSGLGSKGVSLYAIPTSKGAVCAIFSGTYGSAGCFDRFTDEAPVSLDVRDVDQVGGGLPAIVDGLAPSSVKAIDVTVDGQRHSATLAKNAFFYELASSSAWPQAVTITYRNGATRTLSLATAPIAH
jgi:hypothetical protein